MFPESSSSLLFVPSGASSAILLFGSFYSFHYRPNAPNFMPFVLRVQTHVDEEKQTSRLHRVNFLCILFLKESPSDGVLVFQQCWQSISSSLPPPPPPGRLDIALSARRRGASRPRAAVFGSPPSRPVCSGVVCLTPGLLGSKINSRAWEI